jgi:SAM-dependent methyltransferase
MNHNSSADIAKRHTVEQKFHDKKYTTLHSSPHHYQVNPTYRIFEIIRENLGTIKGKHILEYGCGTGWITVELASKEPFLDSFDISTEAINKTFEVLKKNRLEKKCSLKVMSAEALDYSSGIFDIAIGFAILHHLDLSLAVPELHRVLKPGGIAYFAEPLGYNPIINLYRNKTPQFRTPDERPLKFEELYKYTKEFSEVKHNEYYLFALFPFVFLYIPFMKKLYHFFSGYSAKLDQIVLDKFPILGKWAWYSIMELRK